MKKDLSTIGKYFPTGQFKIVDIFVEGAANERQRLMAGGQAYNISLLKTELGLAVANTISNEFLKKEKKESLQKSKDFLNDLIHKGVNNGRYYEFQDFNFYQNDNVAAKEETNGLPLNFVSSVDKAFKDVGAVSKVEYIYVDDEKEDGTKNTYVLGYKPLDGTVLFVMGTIAMPRQISLLD